MQELPAISVVIRTCNSARTLDAVLRRLGRGPEDELIVVDSGSKDATLALAAEHGAKVVRAEGPFNYSRSLNLGFAAARNAWVLVLSSHCLPISPRFTDELRNELAAFPADVAVAFGPCVLTAKAAAAASLAQEATCHLSRLEWERERKAPGGNVNALYRLECWRRHPFDETLIVAEDLEWLIWAWNSGYRAAQLHVAAVLYRNQGGLRHMFVKGFNDAIAARQMLGAPGMTWPQLAVGMVFLVKSLLLWRIPFGTFVRQGAHQYGAFRGSRHAGRQIRF